MESVGERVRKEREAQGMSRAALAKAIGAKGESYISELELGGIKKGSKLHLIAQTLGVELDWLETGRGPKRKPDPVGQEESKVTWLTYMQASAATRAAIDILLLPASERETVCRDFPHLVTGVSLIEEWALGAIAARKTA